MSSVGRHPILGPWEHPTRSRRWEAPDRRRQSRWRQDLRLVRPRKRDQGLGRQDHQGRTFRWQGPSHRVRSAVRHRIHQRPARYLHGEPAHHASSPQGEIGPLPVLLTKLMSGLGQQPDGSFAWAAAVKPDTVWSWINCRRDYGAYVREALESPNFGPGSEVLASSEELTSLQVAEILSKGT